MERRYDVCVIGSGAAGGVVASELVGAGWDVLVVEQGEHVPGGAYLVDLIPGYETARARTMTGEWTEEGYPWTACCVGGGTRFYAGVSLRMRRVDFDAAGHVAPDALPPAWPFGYDELRAHYDWAERALGITSDGGLDPQRPSPPLDLLPAHRPSARGAALVAAGRSLGMRPFPVPLAVASAAFGDAPACADLTACTDYACPSGAKGDVHQRLLGPLAGAPNLTLRTGLKAVRLVQDRPGHVGGLDCLDLATGTRETVRAGMFVVAANAIQSAALLLRSRSEFAPDGLGNDHGMVGRGLCMKAGQHVRATLAEDLPEPLVAAGGRYATVALTDHYLDPDCPSGLGGLILETGPLDEDRGNPRVLRVECLVGDQPMASNRVALDWSALDANGLPRLVIDYRPHPLDLERLAYLRKRAAELMTAAGATRVVTEPMDFPLGSAHLHGTCRMGTDPRASVCDPDGRVHATDNVRVADGALMPYPGGVNPTLTIQALAHRLATSLVVDGKP
ncbi:GMC oxidoreductase [Actinokineospora iranica]|uniref:Paromamine 6'-oxidase / 6'''-hydroxyneomycin C oxidase / 2'-deamino-2'-hydroxyparomamine 6'-oxidase n=1 Tax=Actinokineospora iranica TaxID=1271860 RepID=A0A1G6UAB3_9PSEU|nr:GMC family oxidoreductase [Actinokineospora iranica]SDD38332.1 paromamine 6'-oxidase / 6'''-hydroxyneomycin C oxidase / 2'-deamino-2'-hydroxyparomamine 6'-oxidase [Actinokineospora iranica]